MNALALMWFFQLAYETGQPDTINEMRVAYGFRNIEIVSKHVIFETIPETGEVRVQWRSWPRVRSRAMGANLSAPFSRSGQASTRRRAERAGEGRLMHYSRLTGMDEEGMHAPLQDHLR